MFVKTKGNKRIEMCEKKIIVKRQNVSWTKEGLTESEMFSYPVGIKSTQSVD